MKKLHFIAEAVLFLLVIVLFVLHFKSKCSSDNQSSNDTTAVAPVQGGIAYVNLDSVVSKYQMTKDLTAEIQKKGSQYEADLSTKTKSLQSGVQDLQYKAQRGLEVRSKLEEMQQQLAADEQNLYKLRDSYAMQMQEENTVMTRKVMTAVMDYLKEYSKGKSFQYILGNTFDGKILYADRTLEITNDVIKGLNEKYKAEKDAKK
jgi:outer membrane protein